jgi:ribonucleoside-triphosphate reductase
MSPEDARSMCCRLRLDNRELLKRGGGLFGANPLTGSVGVVTLNLPRIGYLSQDERDFFARLSRQVRLAAESLTLKRKVLEQFTDKNLYPYSKFYLREIKKNFGIYWKNHFSTIGIIGMNEACLNFLGGDIATEAGQAFALRVMDHLRETLAGLQEDTGTLFNLEATPGEGTSYRLAMPTCAAAAPFPITPTPANCRWATPTTCSKRCGCRMTCSASTPAARSCTFFSASRSRSLP